MPAMTDNEKKLAMGLVVGLGIFLLFISSNTGDSGKAAKKKKTSSGSVGQPAYIETREPAPKFLNQSLGGAVAISKAHSFDTVGPIVDAVYGDAGAIAWGENPSISAIPEVIQPSSSNGLTSFQHVSAQPMGKTMDDYMYAGLSLEESGVTAAPSDWVPGNAAVAPLGASFGVCSGGGNFGGSS